MTALSAGWHCQQRAHHWVYADVVISNSAGFDDAESFDG